LGSASFGGGRLDVHSNGIFQYVRWSTSGRYRRQSSRLRPVLVVVRGVGRDDVLEVAAAEDQDPVQALTAGAADPALGVRARLRRPYRCLDHSNTFGSEDLVELAGELAVAVADEEPRAGSFVLELHREVACLLGRPAAVGIRGDPGEMHAASRELDEEQDVEALQEQRVGGEEVALEDARRLRPQERAPARLEPVRRRLDPRLLEDRPDRARGPPAVALTGRALRAFRDRLP